MSESKSDRPTVVLRIAARRVLAADGETVDHWRATFSVAAAQAKHARAVAASEGTSIEVTEGPRRAEVKVTAPCETDVRLACKAVAEALACGPARTTMRRTWLMKARPTDSSDDDDLGGAPDMNLFGSDSDDDW